MRDGGRNTRNRFREREGGLGERERESGAWDGGRVSWRSMWEKEHVRMDKEYRPTDKQTEKIDKPTDL